MANTAGNLGTTWGWGLGENNWKAAHDKNLRAFDALVQCHIIERVLTTPPSTPADGDCYIPATGATGAWSGHVDEIARWNGVSSQWEFWVPRKGWEVFNESDNYAYRWSGTAWAGCNFSFAQLDQNYIKRSGETGIINTTGGFSTSGVTRITAAGVGQFTGLTSSGGATITGATSINGALTLNGATRPAWAFPAVQIDSLSSIWQASSSTRIGRNLYHDGTNFRAIASATGTNYPCVVSLANDGSFSYSVGTADPVAGAVIAITTPFIVSRQGHGSVAGGFGFFGTAAPTTRPTVNAAAGAVLTEVQTLVNQIRTHLIACGLVQ